MDNSDPSPSTLRTQPQDVRRRAERICGAISEKHNQRENAALTATEATILRVHRLITHRGSEHFFSNHSSQDCAKTLVALLDLGAEHTLEAVLNAIYAFPAEFDQGSELLHRVDLSVFQELDNSLNSAKISEELAMAICRYDATHLPTPKTA